MELFNPPITTRLYANISDCERYRYALARVWDESLPKCVFIMLNPSKADASQDDPTIKRCTSFAKSWGCGSIWVYNMFAFRATKPKDLHEYWRVATDPIGPDNDLPFMIGKLANVAHIVFGWGNNGIRYGHLVRKIVEAFPQGECLDITKAGAPQHPLFVKKITPLKPFQSLQPTKP